MATVMGAMLCILVGLGLIVWESVTSASGEVVAAAVATIAQGFVALGVERSSSRRPTDPPSSSQ